MCVCACVCMCVREGYFQNLLYVQTETNTHCSTRQIGFYSPWDFIVHTSLKSTHPLVALSSSQPHWQIYGISITSCVWMWACVYVWCSTWRPRKYCHSWPGANFRTVGKTRLQCSAQTSGIAHAHTHTRTHICTHMHTHTNTHNAEVIRFWLKHRCFHSTVVSLYHYFKVSTQATSQWVIAGGGESLHSNLYTWTWTNDTWLL